MIKTRQGIKRVALNEAEDKHQNKGEKKSKTESPRPSKYLAKDDLKLVNKPTKNENFCTGTAESIGKMCENDSKMKYEVDSDSSSSDEFMKAPFSLDELGKFESLKKEIVKEENENKPSCCSNSSNLSGDSGDDQDKNKHQYYDFSQIIKSQQVLVDTQEDQKKKTFERNQISFLNDSKKSGAKTRKNKGSKIPESEELGVSELLYFAEGPNLKSNKNDDCSLGVSSDNEDTNLEDTYSVPKEGVQVTIELPNLKQKRKSKGFDVEAAMKRRINLIRKENQILMHKVHVLGWIAHCLYLNRTINDDDLLGIALSLIPSKHCYPPKHADLNYLEKLVDWFVTKVVVNKDHKLAQNSSNLPLLDVLETEIKIKAAFSLRDLVLIFVCMVRSLGINARLVVSLRPVPLRPPVNDLCQVNNNSKVKNSSSCTKPNKPVHVTKIHTSLALTNESKNKSLGTKATSNNNSSRQKCHSHYFEKPIKHTVNTDKHKDAVAKQNGSLQSPYFSSSDELPLNRLVCQKPQEPLSIKNKSQKSRNVSKPSALKEKTSLANSINNRSALEKAASKSSFNVNCEETLNSESPSSSKYDSKIEKGQKQLRTVKSNRTIEVELLKNKKKSGRSNNKLCLEQFVDSSEEEVELLEVKPKQNNKADLRRKSSNSSQKIVGNRKTKRANISDDDFKPPKPSTSKNKTLDRRVLSSDEDVSSYKKVGNDFWIEVFLEAEEKWISVDLKKKRVHCIQQLYNGASQPVRYVLACNNDGSLKDVTRRYAPQWLTVTRKQRADDKWWQETIKPYLPHRTQRDRDEDEDLDRQMHDKPLPSSITEYKNHPLFALRRNLLKFEAIYPPDAPPFGFVRGEPVYSRGCVVELHTREAWMKEAKMVRLGEEPYKIVKARPKWDKISQTVINDLPLPLFGHWQVEDYIPPPAVDGKVPRNQYGNVELYKPCMLPPGTVHLQVPMLARVARKLDIDCAPAVVGWEFSGGSSHPVLEGFIVCEEFKDVLLDAWNKEIDESAKRAKEKVEQRVYGNWKRLIRGLMIRERLKLRYDFGSSAPEKKKRKQNPKAGTSKP